MNLHWGDVPSDVNHRLTERTRLWLTECWSATAGLDCVWGEEHYNNVCSLLCLVSGERSLVHVKGCYSLLSIIFCLCTYGWGVGAVRTLFRAAGGEDRQGLRAGYSDRQGKTALVGTYIGVPICSPVCGEWSSTVNGGYWRRWTAHALLPKHRLKAADQRHAQTLGGSPCLGTGL